MKALSQFKGVLIHREPVDMRKAINGLSEIVSAAEMGELMGPYLFVFTGRRRHVIKVLYFDQSGFALWQKRLEKDKFPWPKKETESVVKLTSEQFEWLLDGYDVWKMKPFETLHFERVS
jgi:transposase